MTTPRGPRGNRRPRVAGRPTTRPTGPDRPTSRPSDEETTPSTQHAAEPVEATPEPSPPAAQDTTATGTSSTGTSSKGTSSTGTPSTDAPAEDTSPADDADAVDPATTPPPKPAGPRGKARPAVKVSTIKPQSTRPAAKRPGTAESPGAAATTTRRRRFLGWRSVGIVAAIAVVVGVVAGVAAARPGVDLSNNQAFVDPSLTSQVSAQAKSRICSVFAVNYGKLDDWERTAKANVTGQASTRFTQYAGAVRDALGQTGLTQGGVDCRVDTVGVRSITGDSATLVVNLILSQTEGQQATGSGTKRYQVTMQRVNGQWLVGDFADF